MPPGTVKVTRGPGMKFGNPFRIGDFGVHDAFASVQLYKMWWEGRIVGPPLPDITSLRGKNLACWCPIGSPCHADFLLEIANK